MTITIKEKSTSFENLTSAIKIIYQIGWYWPLSVRAIEYENMPVCWSSVDLQLRFELDQNMFLSLSMYA